jgi:hypothetical protein
MPSYQVPQFLDSGDKIIGPLNLRQFAYALIGGLLVFGLYSYLLPITGTIWSIVIAFFPGLLLTLLAIGKFNGRDAEIYMYALIAYLRKKRTLMYKKVAQNEDLDDRLGKLTFTYLSDTLDRRYQAANKTSKNSTSFKAQPLDVKMAKIRALSKAIDFKKGGGYDVLSQLDNQNRAFAAAVSGEQVETAMYAKRQQKKGTALAARGEMIKSISEKKYDDQGDNAPGLLEG